MSLLPSCGFNFAVPSKWVTSHFQMLYCLAKIYNFPQTLTGMLLQNWESWRWQTQVFFFFWQTQDAHKCFPNTKMRARRRSGLSRLGLVVLAHRAYSPLVLCLVLDTAHGVKERWRSVIASECYLIYRWCASLANMHAVFRCFLMDLLHLWQDR